MRQSHNQEIKQDSLKTQIVSAITDLEGDRDLVDFSKENKTIDLLSPAQAKSPTPKTTFTPTKQVARKIDEPGFKKTIASEKANQREAAKERDESGFKKVRATEKSNERKAARDIDEPGFKKERALERAK